MSKFIKVSLYFLAAILLIQACKKDPYYDRPAGLAEPIYQELQKRGNFTNLLAIIDKSGYKDILGKSGSWTFFAANDAAFQKYFTEKGITGVSAIDSVTARKIALYGLVYNPFRKDQLSSTQTAGTLIPNTSYKRQTAYYDFVYKVDGKNVVDNGQNGVVYTASNNNNKYIPYFITSFLDFNLLNGSGGTPDYSLLYPNTAFGGFNVADAKVVNADIPAENGIIHEIDKVIVPLQSFDQYIASKPEYSEFKKLLDKVATYTINEPLSLRYKVLSGSSEPVYLKTYSGLAFAPNNENTLSGLPIQANSFSMVVPTNAQLKAYTDDVLQFYGGSFDNAPAAVLSTFLNAHMWTNTLWPSRLLTDVNFQVEPATFAASNVIERKVLSNGNFYGLNKVQEPNAFRTIYGKAFLNPDFTQQTVAINGSDLNASLRTPATASGDFKYTMFMLSNTALLANGYFYDVNRPGWGYTAPGVAEDQSAAATTRANRIAQTSVLKTPFNEFDNLAGEGVAEAFNGEYVKYKAGQVQASGNVIDKTFVTVGSTATGINGRVYYTSGTSILKFAEDAVTVGENIRLLATEPATSARFSHFWNYLNNNASIFNSTTKELTGVDKGSFYTVLIPTNAAIETAVRAGRLPGVVATGQPVFTSATWTSAQAAAVTNMIYYSILSKVTVAVDGKKAGSYQTLLKNSTGESRTLTLSYTSTPATWNSSIPLTITDDAATGSTNTTATFSFSNNIANRALIHSINTVLKF